MGEAQPRPGSARGAAPGDREAVRRYAILDTAPERAFDDITAWAARLCAAPMSILSLIDRERHWFKSRFGLEAPDEAGRAVAFCEHVRAAGGMMIVSDARADARFAANPFVTAEPHIRFYAGCPLITDAGEVIGTLSVLDRTARTLAPEQRDALSMLARTAMTQLELRRHVMEVAEAEERTRLIVESTLDAVVTIDATGLVTWNPRAERVFGGRAADRGPRARGDDHPERYRAARAGAWRGSGRPARGAAAGAASRSPRSTARAASSPSSSQSPPGRGRSRSAPSSRDITDRVRLEEQLRQAQKMEAVGQLAGGVAHDFNNLLTVILGRSDLLSEQLAAGTPARRASDLIQTTARKASALTQQLLAFSRKQVLQRKVLDVGAVVAGIVPVLRRLIGEDIEIVVTRDGGAGWVSGDATQLEQVVLNLAVNARDAMVTGGRLTLATRPVELDEAFVRRHRGARAGAHVMVSATDTGQGMDAETQARIFEPFFTHEGVRQGHRARPRDGVRDREAARRLHRRGEQPSGPGRPCAFTCRASRRPRRWPSPSRSR
jgi:GAF domain-containing protein